MNPYQIATDEAYDKASFALEDLALEAECKRRGVRMAFLTLGATFGYDTQKLIKELHAIMTMPMMDSSGNERALDQEVFLRMTYWSVMADEDVSLFSPNEQAMMERSAMEVLGDYQPLTQQRYDDWREAITKMSFEARTPEEIMMN